ncbi:unnamed protein product, partial [Mesorhabditis spiculigera]
MKGSPSSGTAKLGMMKPVGQIISRRPPETDRNRHGFQSDRDRGVFNVLSCQDSYHSPPGRHRVRSSSRAAGNPCLPSPAIANGRPPSNPCFNSDSSPLPASRFPRYKATAHLLPGGKKNAATRQKKE